MAIESVVASPRRVRMWLSLCLASLFLVGFCRAQTPVVSGSVIPTTHGNWNQVIKVLVGKSGNVVYLDWANSGLYQLRPGSSTFTTIALGAPLEKTSTFWNSGMTMDAQDTIYIADRYGSAHFFRIPYNPADGTYDFTSANSWGATIGGGLNTFDVAFVDSSAKDGSGTLVISTETNAAILTVPVDNKGNWGTATSVIKGLKGKAARIAADVNGNIYFLEDEGIAATQRVTGVFFIPAGKTGIVGAADGTAEAQVARLDPITNNAQYSGISLDAVGNIYLSSQADSNGGAFNGTLMVPNSSGNPVGVNPSSFNFNSATFITPVQSGAPVAVDARGFLWIPTGGTGWTPPGSLPYPGTKNVVLWQMGAADTGASPVGTVGTPGIVYYSFSQAVTPGSFALSQPGTGSDFVASSTNPIADPNATTPQLPCTPGKQYLALSSCPYFVSLDPQIVGKTSAQLTMLDSNKAVIPMSATTVSGIGQGAAISLSLPSAQLTLGSGLSAPQQVAADSLGNSYVADSKLGKVLVFAPGATGAGNPVGGGLKAPTGVAVDGAGDVYIADSGNVLKVPFINGVLSGAGQTTLLSGLGSNLKLAAGITGNVFVADPDNARVLEIFNPLTASESGVFTAVGSGFIKPSAVATDAEGNLFVADGNTLSEIPAIFGGAPAAITNSLAGPVTGLAVDSSGSVDVAQAGGILHIPSVAGILSANSAVAFDAGVLTAPNGLAIDPAGNLYVSDLTGGTAALRVIPISSFVDFGQVSPFVPSNPVDVNVFNIGNLPLTLMPDPTFAGTNGAEYSLTPATQNACDTSGETPVAPGTSCIIDVQLTAADVGTRTGTMSVTSNASNAAAVTASLTGVGVNNLERSKVTLVATPTTGISYPGVVAFTVTVAPSESTTTPTGQVILTLINQDPKLHQATVYPAGNLAEGVTTFNLTGLLGGTYTVKAVYHGDTNFSGGLVTTTITVAQGTPGVTLSEPSNITPLLGVYYALLGSNTTLTAKVTSTLGAPTGSISFMNGSTVADPTQNPVVLDANGNATFTTEKLIAGTYNLTAVYSGDQNFSSVASPMISFQVVAPSVLITSDPASLSITAGTPVKALLTLYSLVGYDASKGGVGVFCDNTTLPQYAECTFDIPHPLLAAANTATTTLTISTNLPVNTGSIMPSARPFELAGILGFGLLGLAYRRRVALHRGALNALCLVLLLAGIGMGMSGCTNGGYTTTPPAPHVTTPSGNYNVRVYGIDPVDGTIKTLPFTIPVTVK